MIRIGLFLLYLLAAFATATPAQATNCGTGTGSCFWISGTATWTSGNTANWSNSTGGATCTCSPAAGDSITFDGSSGGGTVTASGTLSYSGSALTTSAHTGTIDFNANTVSPTFGSWTNFGSATRTVTCGTGTFTFDGTGTVMTTNGATNLTWTCSSSTFVVSNTSASSKTISSGTFTFGTVKPAPGPGPTVINTSVITTLQVQSASYIIIGGTVTITNAYTLTGASNAILGIRSSSNTGGTQTISIASGTATMTWASVRDLIFSGGATFTATNSFDNGNNTGITITAPSTGGGSPHIIGG